MVSFKPWNIAPRNRQNLELTVGDDFRFMIKKDITTKGYTPKRSAYVYKIFHIKDNDYMISD